MRAHTIEELRAARNSLQQMLQDERRRRRQLELWLAFMIRELKTPSRPSTRRHRRPRLTAFGQRFDLPTAAA